MSMIGCFHPLSDGACNAGIRTEFTRLEIYPAIYNSEPKEEWIGYVIGNLKDLREFVQQTAAAQRALIAYLA